MKVRIQSDYFGTLVRYVKGHPYRCSRCGARKSLPAGTPDHTEKCHKGCEHGWMRLDRFRLNHSDKCRGERCDCWGPKAKYEPKYQYQGKGEDAPMMILGPHRKGQRGCRFDLRTYPGIP